MSTISHRCKVFAESLGISCNAYTFSRPPLSCLDDGQGGRMFSFALYLERSVRLEIRTVPRCGQYQNCDLGQTVEA